MKPYSMHFAALAKSKAKTINTALGALPMNPSNTPDARPTRAELAARLTEELIRLRNALVSLSLSLKDWQFELDQNGNRTTEKIMTATLDKFRLQSMSKADASPSPGATASKN
jgi:hypothetical protein